MRTTLARLIIATILICGSASTSLAQGESDGGGEGGAEYTALVGYMLPNQISGVTEILPTWGFKYAQALSFAKAEAGFRNTNAEGVDFTVFSLDLRFDMSDSGDFNNFIFAGLDMNAFRPIFRSDRIWMAGAHVGSGLMMHVAGNFWLRGDLGFAISPGTSLFFGVGFTIR